MGVTIRGIKNTWLLRNVADRRAGGMERWEMGGRQQVYSQYRRGYSARKVLNLGLVLMERVVC